MNPLWNADILAVVAVPLLVCAAVVLSGLAWLAFGRAGRDAKHQPSPDDASTVEFSPALLFAALSALLVVVALVLVHLPDESVLRAGPVAPVMIVLTVTIATIGGGPFTTAILSLAMRAPAGRHGGIVVRNAPAAPTDRVAADARDESASSEVLRGGTTIGVLERLAAAGAIIAGFPEALAVIVALKSVGRFSELTSPEAKERFIIGSLASLLWACACAFLIRG